MKDNSIPTAEEVDLFFKLQDKIHSHIRNVAGLCTNFSDNESLESITDDGDGEVTIGVWSGDCGNDSYSFPKDYLSMSAKAIDQRIEDKKREERERRRQAAEKAKATREVRRAERERKKEEKERMEYERLKEKFEGKSEKEDRTWVKGHMVSEGGILDE